MKSSLLLSLLVMLNNINENKAMILYQGFTAIAIRHAIVVVNYDGQVMISMWNQFVLNALVVPNDRQACL